MTTGLVSAVILQLKKVFTKREIKKKKLFGRTWENGQTCRVFENPSFVHVIPRNGA